MEKVLVKSDFFPPSHWYTGVNSTSSDGFFLPPAASIKRSKNELELHSPCHHGYIPNEKLNNYDIWNAGVNSTSLEEFLNFEEFCYYHLLQM